ncbi:MAG: acyl-CoA thioesterase [Lachnospiraceae bacterium]|nr:acyl-CoA thioesterase [Lachnospiraceae bacterium]
MEPYRHIVQYYETDKMGVTHHSNYIRWMEEARVYFLKGIGWDYARLESEGIISPVVEAHCRYRQTTTFSDEVFVTVSVKAYSGVKLTLKYEIRKEDDTLAAEGETVHCFVNEGGMPIFLAKQYPDFHKLLKDLAEQ